MPKIFAVGTASKIDHKRCQPQAEECPRFSEDFASSVKYGYMLGKGIELKLGFTLIYILTDLFYETNHASSTTRKGLPV